MKKIILFCFFLAFSVISITANAQSISRLDVSIKSSDEDISQVYQFLLISDTDLFNINGLKRTKATIVNESIEKYNLTSIITFSQNNIATFFNSNVERKKLKEVKLDENHKSEIFNSIFFSDNKWHIKCVLGIENLRKEILENHQGELNSADTLQAE